jgi:hypothetical protein
MTIEKLLNQQESFVCRDETSFPVGLKTALKKVFSRNGRDIWELLLKKKPPQLKEVG